MRWKDKMGNAYRLTVRLLPVDVLRFDGEYWASDGMASGVLVEFIARRGDRFFVRPENILYTRQMVEDRDERISDRMKEKMRIECCDCGCGCRVPADEWSAAWGQAAAMVRCEPMPSADKSFV